MKEFATKVSSRPRQRLALIGLFAVFFVPILIAWWMSLHSDYWRPSTTVNKGTLVVPTRPLVATGLRYLDGRSYDSAFFEHGWTLVVVDSSACAEVCERQLVSMRQARLALGKEIDRVQDLYASLKRPEPARVAEIQRAHPELNIAQANQQWMASFNLDANSSPGGIYLVDPQGRVMMHYGDNAGAKEILEDLQRLLKISKIG